MGTTPLLPTTHHVTFDLADDSAGALVATAPKPNLTGSNYRLDANQGDTVIWVIRNNSLTRRVVVVEVTGFQSKSGDPADYPLVEPPGSPALQAQAMRGQPASITAHVATNLNQQHSRPATLYVYGLDDITASRTPIADPEIEIPK